MGNLADFIEKYILQKMDNGNNDIVVLRRNELAEEIECAPSQVSYVLNTRFTIERGFIVESRRGLGGFIRIARMPIQDLIYEVAANQIDNQTSFREVMNIVNNLKEQGMITKREGALISQFCYLMFEKIEPEERGTILRSLLVSLADLG